jgi:hypothetical protein
MPGSGPLKFWQGLHCSNPSPGGLPHTPAPCSSHSSPLLALHGMASGQAGGSLPGLDHPPPSHQPPEHTCARDSLPHQSAAWPWPAVERLDTADWQTAGHCQAEGRTAAPQMGQCDGWRPVTAKPATIPASGAASAAASRHALLLSVADSCTSLAHHAPATEPAKPHRASPPQPEVGPTTLCGAATPPGPNPLAVTPRPSRRSLSAPLASIRLVHRAVASGHHGPAGARTQQLVGAIRGAQLDEGGALPAMQAHSEQLRGAPSAQRSAGGEQRAVTFRAIRCV